MFNLKPITHTQAATLTNWLQPERPALIAAHVLNSGKGRFLVDRWPAPRVLVASINKLHTMLGDPHALEGEVPIRDVGLMYCSERFLPWLRTVFAEVTVLDRIVLTLSDIAPAKQPEGVVLRRLAASDAPALSAMSPELQFISNTWDGPEHLAESGCGWGALVDDRLVSVACTFLLGNETEDLGVVTEPNFRGQGLARSCAEMLCQDVQQRGRRVSWTTSADNHASLRVAEKLGFRVWTHESLYVLRTHADRID